MESVKQTAVEWFKKELENYGSNCHLSLDWNTFDELFEQAKEMEKHQISQAYITGVEEDVYSNPLRTGIMYYNETYRGNK